MEIRGYRSASQTPYLSQLALCLLHSGGREGCIDDNVTNSHSSSYFHLYAVAASAALEETVVLPSTIRVQTDKKRKNHRSSYPRLGCNPFGHRISSTILAESSRSPSCPGRFGDVQDG
jgi:hypothetical protein